MLASEHNTVRDWAADALAQLGSPKAVPALRKAYARWRESGEPPNWTEPLNIRRALTALGARNEVLPDRAAALAQAHDSLGRYWRAVDLEAVLDALAEADQVVTAISVWHRAEAGFQGDLDASPEYDLDYSESWDRLVILAREEALTSPQFSPESDLVVTINWIDRSDL